jgi:hypothetical protein
VKKEKRERPINVDDEDGEDDDLQVVGSGSVKRRKSSDRSESVDLTSE